MQCKEEFKRIITDFVNNKNKNKMSNEVKETPKLTLVKQEDISGRITYNVKINGFTEYLSEELEKSKMQFECSNLAQCSLVFQMFNLALKPSFCKPLFYAGIIY